MYDTDRMTCTAHHHYTHAITDTHTDRTHTARHTGHSPPLSHVHARARSSPTLVALLVQLEPWIACDPRGFNSPGARTQVEPWYPEPRRKENGKGREGHTFVGVLLGEEHGGIARRGHAKRKRRALPAFL